MREKKSTFRRKRRSNINERKKNITKIATPNERRQLQPRKLMTLFTSFN